MSLRSKYTQKTIEEWNTGDFGTPAGFTFKGTFMGLIQSPSNSSVFNNQKDTSGIVGVLFCDKTQAFGAKDIIKDGDTYYKISGMAGQKDKGVSGLKPRRGQHAEYSLVYAQEALPNA